ncbi:hypothetical protein Despr_1217 [Desulfobulbus propionicus DSM 2032]|uniref:DUF3108 domain-containing protein n=1 Tax=Desulfobulbus propionicus (strain ATCC 33891 / DSM 2032 / VKM B-1956 / 1pr3) TaxID=577650 RepID=A0A7U3YL44_DESPD|nr:hypothetical protein [Desulfobulbus propionicus]ADW17383.1 hypothetical protein Despr_1217 [Desulfobulbus propionicus DSM 2032]
MSLKQYLLSNRSPLRTLVPLCLALLLMAAAGSQSPVLRYREQTGDDQFIFTWQINRDVDGITVMQQQGDEMYSSRNTAGGATQSWHYVKPPATDVRVERDGNRLRFTGRFAGETIDRIQTIDGRPWMQPLSFSLQRLVGEEPQVARFWTIRPDTLDVLAMQAETAGSEPVAIDSGGTRRASKVVIRPEGLLSAFWQAEYWFRDGDNMFLQYRGTHEPPGTAETRICLITP